MTFHTLDYEYKCETGIPINYYKNYIISIYPIFLTILVIAEIILWLYIRPTGNSISLFFIFNIPIFVMVNIAGIYGITIPAKSNRDVIFELEKDNTITIEEYVEIFLKEKYKLISQYPEKIEFNKFTRYPSINHQGYIEFLDEKIRIRANISSAYFIEDGIAGLQQKNHDLINPPKNEFRIRSFLKIDQLSRKLYKKYALGVIFSFNGMKVFILYLILCNVMSEFYFYYNLFFYFIVIISFIILYPFLVLNFIKNIEILRLINNQDIVGDIHELLIEMGYKVKNKTVEYTEYTKPSQFQEPSLRLKRDDPYYLISVRGRFKDQDKIEEAIQSRIDFKFQSSKIIDNEKQ